MKLRNHILLLVLATVVPMTLFAAALIFYNARLQQHAAERGMRDTARALALALDREIHDITTGVQTLAASRHLDDPPDLRRFYEEAVSVSRSFGGWAVLSDPAGRQFFNTLRPFGEELPLPSDLPVVAGAVGGRSPRLLDGVSVLIADPDADTREVLAAIVAQHGGAPTTVSGAREALAAVAGRRPDVLVCDVAMSGDDGVALIRELPSRPATEGGTTPALAVSADGQVGDAERLLAAGFQSHLAKPVKPAELVGAIGRLAGASSSRSQPR